MSILLLGKDGQLGWQLQRSLAPHGEVAAVGRAECDLSDPTAVLRLVERVAPRIIVNAAAYTAVDRAESEPDLSWRVNAELPELLAKWTSAQDATLVHYSSDYVFDGQLDRPYVESDATAPLSVYGRSKLGGDEAVLAAGGRSLIFRSSWVFGARGNNFVKTILRLAREREQLNVVDDQIGSPTPAAMMATVTGVALGILRQPGSEFSSPRLYHLAAARPVSWCDYARTIVRLAANQPGFSLKLQPEAIHAIPSSAYPTPAARPTNSRLDCSRLKQDFGLIMPDWQPYLERILQLLSLKQNGY